MSTLIALVIAMLAGGYEPAERIGPQHQVGLPPVPPHQVIAGDCDSWRTEFAMRGATGTELAFFFDRGIIWRETRCGLDTLNERTGDSGICQINPVHQRPGYFWGVEYGDGGWLAQFGLRTRRHTDSPAWVDACLFLYRQEGTSPWRASGG